MAYHCGVDRDAIRAEWQNPRQDRRLIETRDDQRRWEHCSDGDGFCDPYPAAWRDPFWPEFAHPGWLPCRALFQCRRIYRDRECCEYRRNGFRDDDLLFLEAQERGRNGRRGYRGYPPNGFRGDDLLRLEAQERRRDCRGDYRGYPPGGPGDDDLLLLEAQERRRGCRGSYRGYPPNGPGDDDILLLEAQEGRRSCRREYNDDFRDRYYRGRL